jgi:hypothetical protein
MKALQGGPAAPVTVLGLLRRELTHAQGHQRRVAEEWDRTLSILRGTDFRAIGPGDGLDAIRGEVEIWNDLTLEPVRRLSQHEEMGDLPLDDGERYDYLHRVLVGTDAASFLAMCDRVEAEVDAIASSPGPVDGTDLRDRVVELMELGVRCSARSIEWLEKRYRDVDLGR